MNLFRHTVGMIVLIVCSTGLSLAQDHNIEVLRSAKTMYERGQFQESIDSIKTIVAQLKPELQAQAYRQLALSYLELNQEKETDLNIRNLLRVRPDYQLIPDIDPISFSALLNQYAVHTKFDLSVGAGVNFSGVKVVKNYTPYDANEAYSASYGYQLNAGLTYWLNIKYACTINAGVSRAGYRHTITGISSPGWADNRSTQQYDEQMQLLRTGLTVQRLLKLTPSLHLALGIGGGYSRVLSSNASILVRQSESGSSSLSTADVTEYRSRNQPNLSGMASIRTPLSKGTMSLEYTYDAFLKTTLSSTQRYQDIHFNLQNHYVNSALRLNLNRISVRYAFPISYRISKKTTP
ncbi:MAG: hypothetical protein H6608_07440 [Flavobacteriales bacterium]|nr:hypothetical protein [Flavobacteriales bacterium]